MVGHPKGVNAAPFDGFTLGLMCLLLSSQKILGLVVIEGGYPQRMRAPLNLSQESM